MLGPRRDRRDEEQRRRLVYRRVALSGMPRWTVAFDLVHRTPDRDDPTIQLITRSL